MASRSLLLAATLLLCLPEGRSSMQGHGRNDRIKTSSEQDTSNLPMNVLPCVSRWRLDKIDDSAWQAAFSKADADSDGLIRLRHVGKIFQIYLSDRGEEQLDFR